MNWWGVLAFPIGTVICFGPVIVAWMFAETGDSARVPQKKKK